jgi:RNA polymerase sigma-70 factor (ECF subfamily)
MDDPVPQRDETVFGVASIRRVGAPSPDALVIEAFDRHQGALNGFAIQLTRDPDAAADLVQEAFLRLVREAKAGRAPDNVRAWLYRVVANLATSRGRRVSVAARLQGRLVQDDTAEAPEAGYLEQEMSAEVSRLLTHVSNDERTALLLSAHGFAGAEIAAVLGRTHLATRTLLCRARARLRDDALALETPR